MRVRDRRGFGDEFTAGSLDKTRFNAIVREDASMYSTSDGQLHVTTVDGDIYTAAIRPRRGTSSCSRPTTPARTGRSRPKSMRRAQRRLRAGRPAGPKDDDNYVKFDILADASSTALNRIELRSEVGGAIQNPQPQLTPLPADDGTVWLRLKKTGTDY